MRIFKSSIKKFRDLKLRTKLVISYVILIALPSIIIGFAYYNTSYNIILNNERKNLYEIVKKNNRIIDIKLSQIQESALKLIIDKELYDVFSTGKPIDDFNYILRDREVMQILDKYFSQYEDVYSTYLVTSYYQFGKNDFTFAKRDIFYKSNLYKSALQSGGKLQWAATYKVKDMFNLKELEGTGIDYPYLFAAVKKLNLTSVESYGSFSQVWNSQPAVEMKNLDSNLERPVLVVNFKESMLSDLFRESVNIKDSSYYIINSDGEIISNSDPSKLGTNEIPLWLKETLVNKTGTTIKNISGRKMLICYDTINVNGWVSVVAAPIDSILSELPLVRYYTLYLDIILIVFAIFLSVLISGWIVKPLRKLLVSIKRMSEGNFDTTISVPSKDEIGMLVHNFNDMNKKIGQLIEENYESKLREKEAHIMALNLQLNPHFLSNTLNTINWMAIENGQKDISKMILSLSEMLQYTMKNHKEMVDFKEDLQWLQNYGYIMFNRFLGIFTIEYDFPQDFYNKKVPKLFLQPFVENSIIHGFEALEGGGVIKIYGRIEDNMRCFYVEDNGKGISKEDIHKIMLQEESNIGVKNTYNRIQLIYGQEYGVYVESEPGQGTKIKITMPL